RVRRYGPLDALKMGRQINALIIAPQNPGGAWNPKRVNNVVDWVFDHYAGDTNRFYVFGMSLGGYGTIDYSAVYNNRIAAAMALCGGGNPKSYCGLNELPLWIIHGTADHAVTISQSQKVIDAMSRCGDSPRLRFTKLDGVDHGGLARAFYISETYDWLFRHRLDDPDRPVNKDFDITVDRLHKAYKDIDRRANNLVVRNNQKSESEKEYIASNEDNTKSAGNQYHTVRKGDTLGKIARNYHTSINRLCQLNNISANSILRIGKRLRVQ
ncbi:MAG: LysM peptidoglycan-binding domain-containing protein, partial [Bacteroidales bacterium]|nr:LysM peptidoglycan-binding domain-containing protein [Bacteroidales bacterium]